jgi:hypothetical protein
MKSIHACAVLVDNKIYAWKISMTPWYTWESATMYLPMPKHKEIRLERAEFSNSSLYTDREVFEKLAPDWFKKWEIHPEFVGIKP